MSFFLYPKEYTNDLDKCLYSFVLKDNKNNRITVPLRMTHSEEKNFTGNEDNSLSQRDLQTIYSAISKNLSGEIKTDCEDQKSEYLLNQFQQQDDYIKTVYFNNGKSENMIDRDRFPTVDACLQSKEFILKPKKNILKMLYFQETQDSTTYDPNQLFNKRMISLANDLLNNSNDLDFDAVKRFTKSFKQFRILANLTQTEVCESFKKLLDVDLSQSTVCRFEAMQLTMSNMLELAPCFRQWMRCVCDIGEIHIARQLAWVKKSIKNNVQLPDSNVEQEIDEKDEQDKQEETAEMPANTASDNERDEAHVARRKAMTRSTRHIFTAPQIERLERLFQAVRHTQVTKKVYRRLSEELSLPVIKIQTWMTKRRLRDRQKLLKKKNRNY